jgi:hypothetical protein
VLAKTYNGGAQKPEVEDRRAHLCKLRLRAVALRQNPKTKAMAIYHLSVKTISRSAGRTATAAAAYRAGVEITDERTGEVYDYTRKAGVSSTDLVLPPDTPEWATDRAALWNAAEQSEKRKNSTVAREFEIALPTELSADQRRELAVTFAREISERHKCAVDVAIHLPGKEGDNRNHHAHILTTTRRLGPDGFGEKCRELDDQKSGEVQHWRQRWGELANAALERAGHAQRLDHRSHADRGLMPETAGIHLGPTATAIERKGRTSERGERNREIHAAKVEIIQAQRERKAVGAAIEAEKTVGQTTRPITTSEVRLTVAASAPQVSKKPKLEDLSMSDQVKAFDLALNRAAAGRREKAARVAAKTHERYERRYKALHQVHSDRPEAPTGMLATFKQRAYKEAADAWSQSYAKAQKLADQAAALRSRVSQAVEKATSWAYAKLRQSHPELVKRVEDHQQAERRQIMERQQKEREAKRVLQKGQDRGRSR